MQNIIFGKADSLLDGIDGSITPDFAVYPYPMRDNA